MYSKNIIRKTKSTCPVCLEFLDAFIVEKDNKVFLSKACYQHGQFEILLSRAPSYYKKLDRFYFTVMDEDKKLPDYEIWPTLRCNMNCPICSLGEFTQVEEELEPNNVDIEQFIKIHRHPSYAIAGAEPTCREDLSKIIQIFKRHRKAVTINTNGLKLIDILYLNELKKSGLDRINLQFDGFNRKTYKIFRGLDLLDTKLKILENLKSLNISTALVVPIVKNVNENDLVELINFAAKNDFINAVSFLTICSLGAARSWSLDNYIMPDELVDILEEKSNCKITRKNIFLFQKLHLAIKSFFSQRYCFYNQVYVLVRSAGSYESIDKYLNLYKMEPWLDRYQNMYKRNKFLAKILLAITLPVSLFKWSFFQFIKELIIMGLSYLFKTARYFKSKKFFYISFTTGCDPYKFDSSFIRNCQNEIIHLDSESKKLEYQGCEGLYFINLERKYLLNQKKYVKS